MIEFNETFTEKLSGKEAVTKRIETRLKHTTSDIPYYERGIDVSEFTYGSEISAIKIGLKDFGASVIYDEENKRVRCYDIEIPVDLELE